MARLQRSELRCLPLQTTASHLQSLAQIDAQTLGLSREKHHRFLINNNAMRGVALHTRHDWIGYAYVSSDGHIGPLAVVQPNAMDAAFRTALNLALESGCSQVSAFLPGMSDATSIAAEYGMQIGNSGVQLLGGHGYVKEHPVERWYRDLRAVGVMEGVVLV